MMSMGALLVFAYVSAVAKTPVDFMALGMGLGMLIAPAAVSNAFEHKYTIKQ